MNFDTSTLERQIPYYLTAEDRQVLVDELEAISRGGSADYILSDYSDSFKSEMLQGDGWRGFQLYNFKDNCLQSVFGLILSNSCDIDTKNSRDIPVRVTFCPLVQLEVYQAALEKAKVPEEKIQQKISAIKAQKITNVFFIPVRRGGVDGYIIRFDDIHSIFLKDLRGNQECEKIFTLSNTGFYMLLFKLTIHFCRFQENVNRK
ncbi:hypothetical protein [Acetobacter ascendens]|uniref:hypothetical protein n=1 Tax=Acetobacter ascendens TaxID=481146 RepID=UPI000875EDBC|nr:hypothetical protein [Acetobacter ascendens]AOW50478.1 hypothetical protein A4R89_08150 [Acetobacter ascendens]